MTIQSFCELLAEFLNNEEFYVFSCHDGFSALDRLQEEHTSDQTPINICTKKVNGHVEIQIRDHSPGVKDKDLQVHFSAVTE